MRDRLSRLIAASRKTIGFCCKVLAEGVELVGDYIDDRFNYLTPSAAMFAGFSIGIIFSLAVHHIVSHF